MKIGECQFHFEVNLLLKWKSGVPISFKSDLLKWNGSANFILGVQNLIENESQWGGVPDFISILYRNDESEN